MSNMSLVKVAYAVVFGCVALIGLPLNAASLWILIRYHRLKSGNAIFLINLALSDLLLGLSLPMRVYFYATGTWSLGTQVCIWTTMLFRNNIRASAIFITFIGVDRLLAVVFPLRTRHLRTTTNTWRACGLVWISIVAVNIPEGFQLARDMHRRNVTTCFEFPDHKKVKVETYIHSGLVFTLLAVNIVSTSIVSWRLRGHLSDSGGIIHNKINIMLIFAINLLMFIVFFLPYSLVVIVEGWRHALAPTLCFASVNCCFDPLLYYFSLDSFWKKRGDDKSHPRAQQVKITELELH